MLLEGIIVFNFSNVGSKSEGLLPYLSTQEDKLVKIYFANDDPFTNPTLKELEGKKVAIEGDYDDNETLIINKIVSDGVEITPSFEDEEDDDEIPAVIISPEIITPEAPAPVPYSAECHEKQASEDHCNQTKKEIKMKNYDLLAKNDPEIYAAVMDETARQRNKIELIASENFVSETVMEANGTTLTNKYAEGYPGKRYYGGCEHVDVVETIAIERAKELFGAGYANVQPHSGAQANMAVFFALLEPGDTVLSMNLAHGGHLSHGSPVNMSGKYWNIVPYGVSEADGRIDYAEVRRLALESKPKLILAGASAYPRVIDFKVFREIADEVGAYLMVDMAHIAGLVAAGAHPSPVPYAHVTTTTTHKTLRGPRGGLILTNDEELAKKINKAIFPGIQGGPLMHTITAKAVCFGEALKPEFKAYAEQIIKNTATLADALMAEGFKLVSGGTDNHLMLVDLTGMKVDTGKEAEHLLDEVGVTCNKNAIPFDQKSPFITSGIRLGTAATTTRGFVEEDYKEIAKIISLTLKDFDANADEARERVAALCKKYPLYE